MPLTELYSILHERLGKGVLEKARRVYYEPGSARRLLEVQFASGERPKYRDLLVGHLRRAVMSDAELSAEREAGAKVEENEHVARLREAIRARYGQGMLGNIKIEEFDHQAGRMRKEHAFDARTVRITWIERQAQDRPGTARQERVFHRSGNWRPEDRPGKEKGWKRPGLR